AGAGGDQQVAPVGVVRHQAEAAVGAAGHDLLALVHGLEQGSGGTAGHVADGDLHRLARSQGMVVDGGEGIAALGRRAVRVLEMHLDELSGDEVQRLAIVTGEYQMAHARREHAAAHQAERELDDGQRSLRCRRMGWTVPDGGPGPRQGAPYNTGRPFPAQARRGHRNLRGEQAALESRGRRMDYDTGVEALKRVALAVQRGRFYALLGLHGAGKSTLTRLVSSLANKRAGDVRLFGVDLHARRSEAMRLSGL